MHGNGGYHDISPESFRQMRDEGEIFESTMYVGHNYGSCKADVEQILARGHHVLTVMDICGAMSLKTNFTKRNLRNKPLSLDEKVNRIIALEAEQRNADICDYTAPVTTYPAAKEILDGLFGKRKKLLPISAPCRKAGFCSGFPPFFPPIFPPFLEKQSRRVVTNRNGML